MNTEIATGVFLQIVEFHLGYDGDLADKRIDELDSALATKFMTDVEVTFLGEMDGSGTVFADSGTLADVLATALANWDEENLVGVADGTWIDPANR
jgi:hypothetical protein